MIFMRNFIIQSYKIALYKDFIKMVFTVKLHLLSNLYVLDTEYFIAEAH